MDDHSFEFHRQSIRLRGYDYALPAAYFITIVAAGHRCLFGKIVNNSIRLSGLGMIVQDCWIKIPEHFLNVEIEPHSVMPNHIHGVITILDQTSMPGRGTIYCAPTVELGRTPTDGEDHHLITGSNPPPPRGNFGHNPEKFIRPAPGSLPTIIRTYKAAVSRIAKSELGLSNIWQRNYYEHIIRNQAELERICLYITSNPSNWMNDPEFTK